MSPAEIAAFQQQLDEISRRQAELYDSMTGDLTRHLDEIAAQVLAALMEYLRIRLDIGSKGELLRTAPNILALNGLNDEFQKLVRRFGYRKAIVGFVGKFPRTFDLLNDTFRVLSQALEMPKLHPQPLFQKPDLQILKAQQESSLDVLGDVPADTGRIIRRKALQSLGGQTVSEMQHMIHTAFNTGTSQAVTLGATAMSTFWRVASDRVYERIDEPTLTFTYFGPLDIKNRVFCRHIETQAREGKTWTRPQIDSMNSGQGVGTVWFVCGGMNCRHSWSAAIPGARGPIPPHFSTNPGL